MISDPVLVAIITTLFGGISGIVGALWRRLEALDARGDQLLKENGELKAEVQGLKDDLAQERTARERERQEYRAQIRRLGDENRILRSALRANGIYVEERTEGAT